MKTYAESNTVHILFHVFVVLLLVWIVALRQYQLICKLSRQQQTEHPRIVTVVNVIKPERRFYLPKSELNTAYLKKRFILFGKKDNKALMKRLLRLSWHT